MLEPEFELPPGTRAGNIVAELMAVELCPPPISPGRVGIWLHKVILRLIHILLTLIRTRVSLFAVPIPRPRLSEKPRVLRGAPDLSFLPIDIAPYRPPALTLRCTHNETASRTKLRVLRSPRSLSPPQYDALQRSLAHVLAHVLAQTQRIERHVYDMFLSTPSLLWVRVTHSRGRWASVTSGRRSPWCMVQNPSMSCY